MKANYILIRFGELTTKGKNRKLFTQKLLRNTKEILNDFKDLQYELKHDRMYIILNNTNHSDVSNKLKTVFGIHSFSIAYKLEKDFEKVKEAVSNIINESDGSTFKINTKRSDKNYPRNSQDLNRDIAGYVFHNATKELKVDVKNPQMLITVEIRTDAFYVMDNVVKGAGGYPVGIGGKALLMMSGGIDSPVAGYLTLKRGVDIECIHFSAPPYTSELAKEKVIDLVDRLRHFTHGKIRVHIVNFTKLQLAVYDHCDESYAMTVMRRMMYRISEQVALRNNCLAIVNGESIGQVASQTLNSMQVINEVIKLPVLRPVLCLDKLEIIDLATKIDTYNISIRPYEDCCTIFTPKAPATKPKSFKAENFEMLFDYNLLINECLETLKTIDVDSSLKDDENFF